MGVDWAGLWVVLWYMGIPFLSDCINRTAFTQGRGFISTWLDVPRIELTAKGVDEGSDVTQETVLTVNSSDKTADTYTSTFPCSPETHLGLSGFPETY